MTTTTPILLPPQNWDQSLSPGLGWQDYRPRFFDHAVRRNKARSNNGLGMSYTLLNPEKHVLHFGVAPEPLIDPGDAPNEPNFSIEDWKLKKTNYINQEEHSEMLKEILIQQVPEYLLKPMKVNNSLTTRSVQYIIEQLDEQFGKLRESDIEQLKANLIKIYPDDGKIRQFTSNQLEILQQLENAGQPLANMDANKAIKSAYDAIDFAPCWIKFITDFQEFPQQTPQNLCTTINSFVEKHLQIHRATRIALKEANRVANQVIQTAEINDVAVINKSTVSKQPKPKTQLTTPIVTHRTQPPQGFPEFWCWSHKNPVSHWSFNCRYPKEGHQRLSTKENPMNSPHT